MNLVSIVIPVYNRKDLISRALKSVMAQTVVDYEIIVVDDASTDGTWEHLNKSWDIPPVRLIRQDFNQGVSAARNRAIRAAEGEWIALLDSDDEWVPTKLEKQIDGLIDSGNFVCHTGEIWIRNGKRVNPMKKHAKSGGWIFQKCLPLCCVSPSSVMIHRSLFDDVGLFDESLSVCEDYDLWLRIAARYSFLYLSEKLTVKYGGHEDQLSRKHWGMDRFRIRALEKILASKVLSNSDRKAAEAMLAKKTRIISQGALKRGKIWPSEKVST